MDAELPDKRAGASAHAPDTPGFVFRAFISYRSADKRYAKWLHRRLERYRLPAALIASEAKAGRTFTARLGRFFRDRDDAAGSDSVAAELEAALAASETLIVVCSPKAADPRSWVGKEIEAFRRLRPDGRILAVVAYGEPPTCFPAPLLLPNGDGATREPLAADMRRNADGLSRSIVKLAAGLLRIEFDKLWRRERRRRAARIALVSAFALALGGAATAAGWFMLKQASEGDSTFVNQQIERAMAAYARGDDLGALEAALQALPARVDAPDLPYDRRAEAVLAEVMYNRALVFRCRLSSAGQPVTTESLPTLLKACDRPVPDEIAASAAQSAGWPVAIEMKSNDEDRLRSEEGADEIAEANEEHALPEPLPPCADPRMANALARYFAASNDGMKVIRYWIIDRNSCTWRAIRSRTGGGSSEMALKAEWESGRIDDPGPYAPDGTSAEYVEPEVRMERNLRFRKDPQLACVNGAKVCLVKHERRSIVWFGQTSLEDVEEVLSVDLRYQEGPEEAALSADGRYLMGISSDGVFEVWDVRKLVTRPVAITGWQPVEIPFIDPEDDRTALAPDETPLIEQAESDPGSLQSCRFLAASARVAAVDSKSRWWAALELAQGGSDANGYDVLRVGACNSDAELESLVVAGRLSIVAFTPDDGLVVAIGEGTHLAVTPGSGIQYVFQSPNTRSITAAHVASDGRLLLDWMTQYSVHQAPLSCQAAIDASRRVYEELAPSRPYARNFRPLSRLLYRTTQFACGD